MHSLRLFALAAFIASMALLCSCHSGKSPGTSGSAISETTSVSKYEDESPPGTDPAPCSCKRSVPSVGVFCIERNVQWYEGWLDRGTANAMRYWRASAATADGTVVTLIAGGISGALETDDATRGLVPPVTAPFTSGLMLEHCNGGPSPRGCLPETSKLLGGFLYVQVDPAGRLANRFWAPWPYIVRTKAIPAGAYSTRFVLLSVPDAAGLGNVREVVYRPNQEKADCGGAADADTRSTTVVVVQPNDGSLVYSMNTVSLVEVTPLRVSPVPEPVLGADAQFLRSVCTFAGRVMSEPMPTTPAKVSDCAVK